ncbi:AAA family ATPase [Phyllobacterium leguminum]|uniref:DNA transposition AAA+ family ATPase n=1 Tax=Phyllobacterium leguminum TaxID=314237 RepID=A0A318SZJ9_9HYPH|nr:AAA family ATPase [Phyllobacterium leguminum]PYE86884.1 hypothetical protein C7477_11822 [Phyllobacterium leguminum]
MKNAENSIVDDVLAERTELAARVEAIMTTRAWSKAEVARRTGLGTGTFSQWLSSTYNGRYDAVNARVRQWLDNQESVDELTDSVPQSPEFLDLAFSREVISALSVAQIMPTMVMVTADAGIGKTIAATYYRETRANCHIVTMSPNSRSVHNMLNEIAAAVGVEERSPARLLRALTRRLARIGDGTLLIVDEAQNLSDEAINQLRHFVDVPECRCGVALLGNRETYARFRTWSSGERYGQLRRRIFKRIRRDKPNPADLTAFIAAWGITDPKQMEFLTGVGMKPGALGQVDMTVKLARMAAQGAQRDMTLNDLRAAWANRDVETA